jgi:dihydrodipicolinate synthase/N-acetylneuraminate lyase
MQGVAQPSGTPFARPGLPGGVFPVLVSPFDVDGTLAYDELASQVRFCVEAGADGVVYPGVVSEFFALSPEEARMAIDVVVREAAGRIPVIAGVSAASPQLAASLTRAAHALGVDAAMCMLPYVAHLFAPDLLYAINHFETVAAAAPLPLVLQNARMGHPLSMGDLARVFDAVPSIRYLKEEAGVSTHRLSSAVAAFAGRLDGFFGGVGGIYLLDEMARGATGTMPSPLVCDRLVAARRLALAGREDDARRAVEELALLAPYELLYNLSFIKAGLRERGIITHVHSRAPAPRLDATDLAQLRHLSDRLGLVGTA